MYKSITLSLESYKKQYANGMLILSLMYLIFISLYSINQYDLGFQLSMVSRIKSGQIIYKDFDYVRPFFSIVFWDYLLKAVPLTSEYLILISRILVIVQSFIICYLIQKIIFNKSSLQVTIFLLICFLHTFPIMPWHTIDGIFFSIISLFFYQKKWYLSTLIFIIFASFTKQSFFIFGLAMGLIILRDLSRKFTFDKKDFYISIPAIVFLIIILFQYHIIDNFKIFFNQIFNSSASSGFYENSIAIYFFDKNIKTIIFIITLLLFYFIKINKKYIETLLLITFPVLLVFPFFNQGTYSGIHSLFLIMVVLFLKYEPRNSFIFLLLFLGWSSSISWGYNTPIFFIFIFLYKFIEKRKQFFLLLWGLALTSFLLFRIKYTYLSDSLINSKYIFSNNVKSISGLWISEHEYQYVTEAQEINKIYKHVIFLPGSPILDIINTSFPNRASWEMDVEYPNWKQDLSKLKTNVIAVDNAQSYYKEGFYKSSITLELIKQKKIIKKTKYFTIYGN